MLGTKCNFSAKQIDAPGPIAEGVGRGPKLRQQSNRMTGINQTLRTPELLQFSYLLFLGPKFSPQVKEAFQHHPFQRTIEGDRNVNVM
jgi:hypothetical protein